MARRSVLVRTLPTSLALPRPPSGVASRPSCCPAFEPWPGLPRSDLGTTSNISLHFSKRKKGRSREKDAGVGLGLEHNDDDDDDEGEGTGRDGTGGDQTARAMPELHGEASVMEGDRWSPGP